MNVPKGSTASTIATKFFKAVDRAGKLTKKGGNVPKKIIKGKRGSRATTGYEGSRKDDDQKGARDKKRKKKKKADDAKKARALVGVRGLEIDRYPALRTQAWDSRGRPRRRTPTHRHNGVCRCTISASDLRTAPLGIGQIHWVLLQRLLCQISKVDYEGAQLNVLATVPVEQLKVEPCHLRCLIIQTLFRHKQDSPLCLG
jgi:hypothetical protein